MVIYSTSHKDNYISGWYIKGGRQSLWRISKALCRTSPSMWTYLSSLSLPAGKHWLSWACSVTGHRCHWEEQLDPLKEQAGKAQAWDTGIQSHRKLCTIAGESSGPHIERLVSGPAMPLPALSKSPPLLESRYALGQDDTQLLALSPRRILWMLWTSRTNFSESKSGGSVWQLSEILRAKWQGVRTQGCPGVTDFQDSVPP